MKNSALKQELRYRTSRSSGSGGQHVNKVETKVELLWAVHASALFTAEEKIQISDKLRHQINKDGVLRIYCQSTRSQFKNKNRVTEKFYLLLEKALEKDNPRIRPATPKRAKANRLKNKHRQADKKAARKKVNYQSDVDLLSF